MCICISDVQYIYIYTYNHTVCMSASGFQEMNCQYFCFLFALIFCGSWHFGIKRLVFQLRLPLEILLFYLEVLRLVF
jgi:hypothetical protein